MNMKAMMMLMTALVCGIAHAITSEEIATALGVDPSIGTFSCSGVSDWSVDTDVTNKMVSSMRSGAVSVKTDGTWEASALTMSLTVKEASRLSFGVKTSCYSDSNYVRLRVTIDDASLNLTYAGETSWRKVTSILIPGTHSIKWEYAKRRNYNSGSDCAWVEQIALESILPKSPVVSISDIKCTQRTPWNGKVDIDYTVTCDKEDADIWVYPVGYDKDTDTTMAPRALEGDGANAPVKAGTHRMTWTVTDDYPNFNSTAFTVKMTALVGAAPYMVVDLSGGVDAISYPVSYLSSVPAGGWGDEYKTTKLVLRLIPSGSFWMGSPSDEFGRDGDENRHGVVLTKPFYIGVFECTQKQYQLVMGTAPSNPVADKDFLWKTPVNNVSYNNIRGNVNGAGWPTHNQVDADSFMGRLRSKANMLFDLPTEAQWEYACRAGTSTALNSGKNLTSTEACKNMAEVGRFRYGQKGQSLADGKAGWDSYQVCVGQFLPNAWGLYDMHGNVWELCRDLWYYGLDSATVVDPVGTSKLYYEGRRVYRGGAFDNGASACRAARRMGYSPSDRFNTIGFRVYCSPVAQ